MLGRVLITSLALILPSAASQKNALGVQDLAEVYEGRFWSHSDIDQQGWTLLLTITKKERDSFEGTLQFRGGATPRVRGLVKDGRMILRPLKPSVYLSFVFTGKLSADASAIVGTAKGGRSKRHTASFYLARRSEPGRSTQ